MSWWRWTKEDYLAEAEFHKAKADVYEAKLKLIDSVPSTFVAQIAVDRGLEAKYRKLAEGESNG